MAIRFGVARASEDTRCAGLRPKLLELFPFFTVEICGQAAGKPCTIGLGTVRLCGQGLVRGSTRGNGELEKMLLLELCLLFDDLFRWEAAALMLGASGHLWLA